jgi:hypothetical protein
MLVLFIGHWTSSRCTDPYGCCEFLHQGRGRGIHQENLVLLSRLEPDNSKCESTDKGSYCPRFTPTAGAGISVDARNSIASTTTSESAVAGSAGGRQRYPQAEELQTS